MTLFRYSRPDVTGIDAAVVGDLEFQLVNREEVEGRFRVEQKFTATLLRTELENGTWVGQVDVTLPTTGPTQGLRIRERLAPTLGSRTYVVAVPSPAPLYATDLVEVDPATLIPSADSIPAWEAITESIGATLTGAQNAASQAESSAITANASAGAASDSAAFAASVASSVGASVDSAAQSASDAAGSATESATYATNAAGSATDAAGSATAAEASRQAAADVAASVPGLLTDVPTREEVAASYVSVNGDGDLVLNGVVIPIDAGLTEAQVTTIAQSAAQGVVDGAPGALDTLNELAAALGDDANFAATVTASLAGKADRDARAYGIHDLNSAPYNLNPGDEATTAIQTAINAIVASGKSGTIRFSKLGTYLISGAQQTGTYTGSGADPYNWSGQIVYPATPFNNSVSQAITIEGPMTTSTGNTNTGLPDGVILKSNATSGYVFDMIPGYEYAGLSSTGIMPIFKNLILRVPDNQTCGGFNVSRAQHAHFEGITSHPTSFTNPTGSLPFITMPALNSNGDCILRDIYITRWTTAINLSEHVLLDNVLIAYCDTAFEFSGRTGGHRNYFGYVDVEQVNKVFRVRSGVTNAAQVWGQLDIQSSSGWKMILLSDETTSGGKLLGRIDVAGIQSGSLGLVNVGGTGLDVANGGRGQSAGWTSLHPQDTFGRIQGQSMSGTANGAPGYTWPTMHPWRLHTGDVALAAGSGASGNMRMLTGQSLVKALLPMLDARTGGRPRTIEGTFTVPAGNHSFVLVGNRRYNGDVCIYAQVRNGTLYLGVGTFTNGTGKVSKAAAVANSTTITMRLDIAYVAGVAKVARVFINGVLQLSYTLTAAESASVAPSTTAPFGEDGIYWADSDTSSTCTNFAVRDLAPEPAYLSSGTVTLVAGTATVADAQITAGSVIRVFRQGGGGTLGALSVAVTAGTGFTITSSSNTDTSVIYYEVAAY